MSSRYVTLCAVAFFLSGCSALTYEILWQRRMFLIFGASAPATTAILTAIFLGIAIGSRAMVPVLKRSESPLKLYACLEGLMAFWGVIYPFTLSVADRLYVSGVATLGEGHPLQTPLRFTLAILAVLPATLAMGGTIPVMVRCIRGLTGSAVAWAYGINIVGSVLGALLTGFVWLRVLGLESSRFVGVATNLLALAVVLALSRVPRPVLLATTEKEIENDKTEDQALPDAPGDDIAPRPPVGMLPLYVIAGFVALGLEVVWLRYLGIVNTNSTITFTLTVAIYLLGMGIGSLVIYPVARKRISARGAFVLANFGTALGALSTFGMLYAAAAINISEITDAARFGTLSLSKIYWTESRIAFSLMFLPTLFMGLAYPAVCDMARNCQGTGEPSTNDQAATDRWVAASYFYGTMGSVVGILFVSMWIIPAVGLHGSFALLVCLSLLAGLLALGGHQRKFVYGVAGVFVAGGGIWSYQIAADGRPVLRETIAHQTDGRWFEFTPGANPQPRSELKWVKAGASGTVMIKKEIGADVHLVYVDDQLVASTNLGARVDSLMLAHLPLLLHPDPQNALTVGFGTGGTSNAMTTHGVETYCVEIEPEVPRAAGFSQDQNFSVVTNPRFHLILNDARDHLHSGTRSYDVIATDVTNLQYKQNSNLYTVEYFDLMRQKLNPEGIACAWIPMAAIDLQELQILIASFQEVFPHTSLWFMNHTHTNFGILIGTPGKLQVDYDRLQYAFETPTIAGNLKLIGMTDPLQFLHCLHLDEEGCRAYCGDIPLHTDNHPVLEFSSPMSFYKYHETFRENLAASLEHRPVDFEPFIVGLPDDAKDRLAKHETASSAFCEFLVHLYDSQIARARRDRPRAMKAVRSAIEVIKTGMEAWPEDRVREEFYVQFLEDAQPLLRGN